jgi:hypothetical protein
MCDDPHAVGGVQGLNIPEHPLHLGPRHALQVPCVETDFNESVFAFCFGHLSRRRCVGNVGIPKGFPLLVISNANACHRKVGPSARITDEKRVF